MIFVAFHSKEYIMESKNFSENWEQAKKRLQEQYPHLTNDDLAYEIGKEGELLKRLQVKTGKTKRRLPIGCAF